MKYIYAFLLCLFAISNLYGINLTPEQVSEMVHSTKRSVTSLQGQWERSVDGGRSWGNVSVPFSDYETGEVIYQKEIVMDSNYINSKTVHLFFLGIAGRVEVYFNGGYVMKIDGQYLPADIVIPKKMLINGKNELRLVFLKNNEIDVMRYRAMLNAPKLAKGIIREPMLVGTSDIYVSDVKFQVGESNVLKGTISLTAGKISEQIIEKDDQTGILARKKIHVVAEYRIVNKRTGEIVSPIITNSVNIEVFTTAKINFNINTANLKNWSSVSPELYKLVISIKQNGEILDEYFVNYGKRYLSTRNDVLLLNGESLELKIIGYTEMYGGNGATISTYRLEEDIKNIKLLGANAIQVKGTLPSAYLVNLCEKYGLLLLVDLPLNNTHRGLLNNPSFIVQSKIILEKLLQTYSTSPSFVGIGIGNCVLECNEYDDLAKKLIAKIKNYNKLIYKQISMRTSEFSLDGCDLLMVNTMSKNLNTREINTSIDRIKKICSIPLILSFGTIIHPDNLNSYSDPMSNDYQSFFFKNCYDIFKNKELSGVLINSYSDNRTNYPIMLIDYYDQNINTDGITDQYRRNRPAVMMLKALFNDERLPLLNPGTDEQSLPYTYVIIGLILLFVVIYMINRYNRFRTYFFRAFVRPYNFFADIRDHRILSIIQTLILGIILAFSLSLCLGGIVYNLRTDIAYNYLISALFPFNIFLVGLCKSVWHLELLLLVFTIGFIVILAMNAVILRIIAIICRAKVFMNNAITITIWAVLPFILLLPLGIVLSKLVLFSPVFIDIFFMLASIMLIWSYHRLLKAISVVFDKPQLQIYLFGLFYIILFVIIPLVLYESQYGVSYFLEYFTTMHNW